MKGLPFFDRKNTKGVPFLSKIVYRGIRGWTLGRRVATLNFFEYLLRPVTRILYGGGGVLTRPKWTKLPKCIFYCLIRLFRKVAIHEKL